MGYLEYWGPYVGSKFYVRVGGRDVKKYKFLWYNTLKFRYFVVLTAFFKKLEGGVMKKYSICSFPIAKTVNNCM